MAALAGRATQRKYSQSRYFVNAQRCNICYFVTRRVSCVHVWSAGLSVAGSGAAGPGAGGQPAAQSPAAVQLREGAARPRSHLGARPLTPLLQPDQDLCADLQHSGRQR